MAHFVMGGGNRFINLDHIVALEARGRGTGFDALSVDGNYHGTVLTAPEEPTLVIPNTLPGYVVIAFWGRHADLGDDDNVTRYPVVAWRVHDDNTAVPVTIETLSEVWCLEQPAQNGQGVLWVFPEDCLFSTWADAQVYAASQLAKLRAIRPSHLDPATTERQQ